MITLQQLKDILADQSPETIETLAKRSQRITEQYFGRTISLYAPLYLSNYCSSYCTYCGFHKHNRIKRGKLTPEQMHKEMSHVAESGIQNILLLTGESYNITPLSYLQETVKVAQKYFTSISLEVHPMETEEYRTLFCNGVDGITIYQETYDRKRYKEVHVSGIKSNYDYRVETPKRIAQSGIRQISLGILLGLGPVAEDVLSLYEHLRRLEKQFPGVEYSLSFPRLRKVKGRKVAICEIDDVTFIKIICLTRILFPRVGINLTTRESPVLRNHTLALGITRMSAGSNTSVGGYNIKFPEEQDPQFDIEDSRSLKEIIQLLKRRNFDPVLTDWRPIQNETICNN